MQVSALDTKPTNARNGEVDVLMSKLDGAVLVCRENANAIWVKVYETVDTRTDLVWLDGKSRKVAKECSSGDVWIAFCLYSESGLQSECSSARIADR